MATFLLIHGGLHGGWCWEKVVPRLRAAGHRAIAPDLPGMAVDDPVAAANVTLAMTADFVAELVRAQDEPVVLVGHSMGGITISAAAERVPERIAGLVYLSAMLIPPGRAMFETTAERGSAIGAAELSEDGMTIVPVADRVAEVFYNSCDPDDVVRAIARLRPQPVRPGQEPVATTADRFGRVPRAYVECLRDNAMPLDFQRLLQAYQPCDPVFALDTDHSPFLCAPDDLVAVLIAAGERFAERRA